MPRALCLLREQLVYRRAAFCKGLAAAGYERVESLPKPGKADVLVIWNRYGGWDEHAKRFEAVGARVLIAENSYLPLPGGKWVALALGHHAGAGTWKVGGPERWSSLGIELLPWRQVPDGETIILGQRGIGETGIASPVGWAEATKARIGGRIRKHPGKEPPTVPLEQDLERAACVVTWGSSAALRALMFGVPVWYDFPRWIGGAACQRLSTWGGSSKTDDEARLQMFQRLIWAQWTLNEIESGAAFEALLG